MDNIPSLLKAFVIGGGILLVGGTLVLTALIIQRAGSEHPAPQRAGSDTPAPRADATIDLPQGARVEQVVAAGERWLLLGTDALGQQFLVEVDPRTGERMSLLWLRPGR